GPRDSRLAGRGAVDGNEVAVAGRRSGKRVDAVRADAVQIERRTVQQLASFKLLAGQPRPARVARRGKPAPPRAPPGLGRTGLEVQAEFTQPISGAGNHRRVPFT